MTRFELVDGYAKVMSIMANDDWEIINTFPNPYPQPYFFALMSSTRADADEYDVEAVKDIVYKNNTTYDKWTKSKNDQIRQKFVDDLPY